MYQNYLSAHRALIAQQALTTTPLCVVKVRQSCFVIEDSTPCVLESMHDFPAIETDEFEDVPF